MQEINIFLPPKSRNGNLITNLKYIYTETQHVACTLYEKLDKD